MPASPYPTQPKSVVSFTNTNPVSEFPESVLAFLAPWQSGISDQGGQAASCDASREHRVVASERLDCRWVSGEGPRVTAIRESRRVKPGSQAAGYLKL